MSSPIQNRNLNIIIAGAGIAGVTAAVALRQTGHTVLLLDKSAFANPEVGAAINVTPNGARVLRSLGFDFERALAYRVTGYNFVRGENLEKLNIVHNVPKIEPGTWAVLRADLHAELMRLARDVHDETGRRGWGPPVDLRVGARVQSVISRDDDGAEVTLESGETISAHIVIGADGANSVARSYVLEGSVDKAKPVHSGMAAFRFLIETDKLKTDKLKGAQRLEGAVGTVTLLADMAETEKEKHIIWYGCHGNELQNFVGIHSSETKVIEESDGLKEAMMLEYSHIDSSIKKIIGMASHLKRWPLYVHDPISTWVRGRVVLIGDAVHPMMPFGAQGANIAIEDGAALGMLLKGNGQNDIAASLAKFEKLRKNRAARVQILSSVRAGRETEVQEKLTKYLDSDVPEPPKTNPERCIHDWGYDVLAECEKLVK